MSLLGATVALLSSLLVTGAGKGGTSGGKAVVGDFKFTSAAALPFNHAGKWVTDATGKVVILHGENVVNKHAPYFPSALGFDDKNAEFLAQEGFNAVRLGFFWSEVEPQPGKYNDAYLAHFRDTIATLHRHGLATVIEAHEDMWGSAFDGDGAPEWATLTNGEQDSSSTRGQVYLAMMTNPAMKKAFDNFFANAPGPDGVGLVDAYAAMWKHVASALRGTPGLVGYGVITQPSPGSPVVSCLANSCPQEAFDRLDEFNKKVSDAIRSVDGQTPIHLCSYFPGSYGAAIGMAPPPAANSAYGFNSYCIAGALLDVPFPACTPQYDSTFAQTRGYLDQAQVPGVINEFGSTDNVESINGVTDLADDNMLGWFHWSYHSLDTTNTSGNIAGQSIVGDPAQPLSGDNVHDSMLTALARPYPELTSGVPQDWKFDIANHHFNYAWDTNKANGNGRWPAGSATAINVPHRAYPNGYSVVVTGGHVISPPNARVLQVASDSGADQVSVEITEGA